MSGDPELPTQGVAAVLFDGERGGNSGETRREVRVILGRLNVAAEPRDMSLPGLHLHPLKGEQRGRWAVKVSGNWRLTFGFAGKDVEKVDYEDYH